MADLYCVQCGERLDRENGTCRACNPSLPPPPPFPSGAPPTAQAQAAPLARPRLTWRRAGYAFAGVAGLILIAVCSLTLYLLFSLRWQWNLVPSALASIYHNGWSGRLQPAELPTSGVPALDVSPDPAIRLTAPANALDKPRTFKVTRVPSGEIERYASASANTLTVPLAAFDLDGQMAESEQFPGEMELCIDTEKLGVSAEFLDEIVVNRVDPEGRQHALPVRRSGSGLRVSLRHNGIIVVGGLLIMIEGLKVLYLKDQYDKGAFEDEMSSTVNPYFRVHWPRKLGQRNTPELQALEKTFRERWAFYEKEALLLPEGTDERQHRLKRYLADPEVKAAYAKFHDLEWRKKYYFPVPVTRAVQAMERAGQYLFGERQFAKREEKIDVHLKSPWPYPNKETYAYQKDGHFTYPYIHVNLDKVPASETLSADDQTAMDNLQVTLVHEIFHVVQKEYFYWTKYLNPSQVWGGGKFQWFTEATAVVLEEEARTYYIRHQWVNRFPLTVDNLYASQQTQPGVSRAKLRAYLKQSLESGGDETELTHRGYAAGEFLVALRDKYYAANPDAFLKKVLECFNTFRTGGVDALVKATSTSEKVLGSDYLNLVSGHANDIATGSPPQTPFVTLSPDQPVHHWTLEGALSTPTVQVMVRGVPQQDLARSVIACRTNGLLDYGIYLSYDTGSGWPMIANPGLAGSWENVHAGQRGPLSFQRVETYLSSFQTAWIKASPMSSGKPENTLLLLAPPKGAPTVRFNAQDECIHVEIPASALYRQGEILENRVIIHPPGNRKPMTFSLGDKTSADIKWEQIFKDTPYEQGGSLGLLGGLSQDTDDMLAVYAYIQKRTGQGAYQMAVSYYEVAKWDTAASEDPGLKGPESEVFKVPVDGLVISGTNFNVAGTWHGQIMLMHYPITVVIESGGSELKGTYTMGGSTQGLLGKWVEKEDGYETQLCAIENGKMMPSGITVYLRKLPGGRLWLSAPPVVLYPDVPPIQRPKTKKEKTIMEWLFGPEVPPRPLPSQVGRPQLEK